jgi:hypothetical protein
MHLSMMRLCSKLKILSEYKKLENVATPPAMKLVVKKRAAVKIQKLILSKMIIRLSNNICLNVPVAGKFTPFIVD